MFVDRDDLEQLTGYVRRAEQVKWLRANGIAFRLSRRGDPMVLVSELERSMSSQDDGVNEDLNWEALKAIG
jgi:hypothetical protein